MLTALLRTIILYLLIIVGIRLMGKRQVGELEPSELVLALIIADLASVPMQDFGIPLISGIIPIATLLSVTMILSIISMKSIKFRAILCGKPSIVVQNGKLQQREMRRNRFTIDELAEELRIKGVTDITTVKYAILETNGQMTVILNAPEQPATAAQVGLSPAETGLPIILVNDGRIMHHNLHRRGLNLEWLNKQIKSNGAKHAKDVFLLTVDEQNTVYFSAREMK